MNKTFLDAINRLVSAFSRGYQAKARVVINRVTALLNEGLTVAGAVDQALKESEFFQANREKLTDLLFSAAAKGFGIDPKIVLPGAKAEIKGKLLNLSWAPDKMNLSSRLHSSNPVIRKKIINKIQAQIKEGTNVVSLARSLYDGYGFGHTTGTAKLPKYLTDLLTAAKHMARETSPTAKRDYLIQLENVKAEINNLSQKGAPTKMLQATYAKLVKTIETMSVKAINKAVYVAVMEKSRYYAERIARTEIARAWGDGYYAKTYDDDDVMAYEWNLSSRHPEFDICDFHAKANLYGLGAGIYPKTNMPPYPAHPHCTCQLSSVITDSIDKTPTDNVDKGGQKYLNKLSDSERDKLMTFRGNEAYKAGRQWQNNLKQWRGHTDPNPRLAKSDFKTKGTA